MELIDALHTAGRRYLTERFAHWAKRYQETGGGRSTAYTAQDRDTFPRYQVAAAMLEGVERLRPESMSSLEAARDQIAEAALAAQTGFTHPPRWEIEARAMEEERALFGRFIQGITVEALAGVDRLPFRRVLSDTEAGSVRSALRKGWQVDTTRYWYPLDETSRGDVIAFQAPYFARDAGANALRAILARGGFSRLWELREWGPSYEIDLEAADFDYDGAEGFWCAAEPDGEIGWLVYASHESSLTLGGDWLIDEVREIWPSWAQYLWTPEFV